MHDNTTIVPENGRNRRPIYVQHTINVPKSYVDFALQAVREVTKIAGVDLPINYFGAFDYGEGDFQSAKWYAKQAWNPKRWQLNASEMLRLSRQEPYQKKEPHYEVWITGLDMWTGTDDNRFVFGLTQSGFGSIQSYERIEKYFGGKEIPAPELFKDMVEHEVAHMFRTPRAGRSHTQELIGTHCTNDPCIMGQVNVTGRPSLLEAGRSRRRQRVAFCDECTEDLQLYFQ